MHPFESDTLPRKVTIFLLIFQGVAFFLVILFLLLGIRIAAIYITFINFVLLSGVFLWLYIRYRLDPIVTKKRSLLAISRGLHSQINKLDDDLASATRVRGQINHGLRTELVSTLKNHQYQYIRSGLLARRIADAKIDGIGPVLKANLSRAGINTAADFATSLPSVPGLGEVKSRSLLQWRRSVLEYLDNSKPASLPLDQIAPIQKKYADSHTRNDALERELIASRQPVVQQYVDLQPRLEELRSVTFLHFLKESLHSRKLISRIFAAVLIFVPGFLSCMSSLLYYQSLIPAPTPTPTITATPTLTLTATITPTSTITLTPTITDTPTITSTPTNTSTPTRTPTRTPTHTRTPSLYGSGSSGSSGGSGIVYATPGTGSENCDPSYPDVCIPPYPPDLNCPDILYRYFRVVGSDPHGFDGDFDGWGCETP